MSGAEHLDIASAHLKGVNESVACANVHIEPFRENESVNSENDPSVPSVPFELPGERKVVYADTHLSKNNEDGGSITNLAMGKCLGDSLNATQTVGKGLGMLENKVQACEHDGMWSRMSNCSTAQQSGDGLNPGNGASEHLRVCGDDSRTSEPADVTRVTPCGNEGTSVKNFSPAQIVGRQPHTENSDNCYGPARYSNGASTCKNDEILKESLSLGKSYRNVVAVEDGNQVSICDLTEQSGESITHAPSHEGQTCEPSRLEHPVGLNSLKSELSNLSVDKTNSVVPETVIESLIPKENAVGLPGELNSQNKSANLSADSSSFGQPGSCGQRLSSKPRIGDQDDQFGYVSLCDWPAEEKIGSQLQKDSTAKGNNVEGSSEDKCGSGCFDDWLNKSVQTSKMVLECTSPERVVNGLKVEKIPETPRKGIQGSHSSLQSEQKAKSSSGAVPDNVKIEQTADSNIGFIESSPTDGANRLQVDELEKSHHGMSESSSGIEKNESSASDIKNCPSEQAGLLSDEITGKPQIVVFGCPANDASEKPRRGRRRRKFSAAYMVRRYPRRSSVDSARVMRSKSQDTPEVSEPSNNLESKKSGTGKRRGRRKKTEMEGKSPDEFSRMRTHLRYLLHRIRYEQYLLDAYSSEGWRGQSLEKLRPEKELQRAKADINRSKLKIRDLFKHLDSLSAEGRFPDSLFDSEGLIDSEDIFCAKCGSKELSTDNDIILCDGACDRGFHQFCLEPPLRTEEIPPGDQGWLCPACDCKADCIALLNDSQTIKLTIEDSWEKVFPEAVASLAGNELDDIMGLPSDDSEDHDYNPDGADDEAKLEESGSSSDGSDSTESDSSDFSSVSEDLGAGGRNDQYLGLPSDDSEDDDYDPDGANINEDVERESSSSDFTSASEDLVAAVNDGSSGDDDPRVPLVGPDEDTADSPPVSGKRHVERLDYKKLYVETYGNAPSDSSDDEEWTDVASASKTKASTEKGVSDSSIGNASASAGGSCSASAPRRRGRKNRNMQAANGSPAQPVKSSEKTSCGRSTKRPHNRLGEAVTRRLYESFKENQYPDRTTKEKLAKELGLTPNQVDKWFGNARWSFHHHRARIEASMAAVASTSTPLNIACNGVESAPGDTNTAVPGYGVADSSKLDSKGSKRKYTPKNSRKRKRAEDNQPTPQSLNAETSKGGAQTDSFQTPEAETDAIQTPLAQLGSGQKRRKSSA